MNTVSETDAFDAICDACIASLNAFAEEANKTYAMLKHARHPSGTDDRIKLHQQRQLEAAALDLYQKNRQTLFAFLDHGL